MFFVVSFLSCFRCGYFRNDRAVFIGCHIDPVYLYICIANTRIFIVNSYAYVFIGIKPDLLIISHYPVALRFTDSDFRLFSFDHSKYIIGYSFTLICIFYIGATQTTFTVFIISSNYNITLKHFCTNRNFVRINAVALVFHFSFFI